MHIFRVFFVILDIYLQNIILSSQVKHLASDVEGHDRQGGDLLTVNEILERRQRIHKENFKQSINDQKVTCLLDLIIYCQRGSP